MTAYRAYQRFAVDIRGHRIVVVGKPGVWSWRHINPGTRALLEVVDIDEGDHVLDLGCGSGFLGLTAARMASAGRVTMVDCNVAAVSCARLGVEAMGVGERVEVQLADGVQQLQPAMFDLVLSHLPRGRDTQQELIRGAAWALKPGGRLYFVAHKKAGVGTAIAAAKALLGRCGVIRQKKGYHVAMAIRPAGLAIDEQPFVDYTARAVYVDGCERTLISKPGIFAWDRLDDGTAALIAAMEVSSADRLLDLGCGTGLAALVASQRASQGMVVGTDVDVRAVEAARRTLTANGVRNAEVRVADCAEMLADASFDVVVTNPPFHQGVGVDFDVAHQFVCESQRLLRTGGRLFLVANAHIRYDDLLCETFGQVQEVKADTRFRVLSAMA